MTKKKKIGSSGKFEGIPYFAVGNGELDGQPEVGKTALCPHCKKFHKVEYGIDIKTGKESKMLAFVKCGKSSYLVAIGGKLLK